MLSPADLIATARVLFDSALQETYREQAQSHLKRAVSTAYYAMFHAICASAAELLQGVGTDPAASAAWLQAYRGPEHTHARNQCRNSGLMAPFPTEVKEFARVFVENQGYRNQADYNPLFDFSSSDVSQIIEDAEIAIDNFLSAPAPIRRAFAVTVLLRNRAN